MKQPALVAVSLLSFLLLTGCGLFRRGVNTSLSSSVEINQQHGRDIATLSRDDYVIHDIRMGEDVSRQVFLLFFPIGAQISPQESSDNAYFQAISENEQCDALLMPYVHIDRKVLPLLVVNIITRTTQVKGRCIEVVEAKDSPQ